MNFTLHEGDCLAVMREMLDGSVDSIVTDPPYHLTTGKKGGTGPASASLKTPHGRARVTTGFMGMTWDGGDVAHRVELWEQALRVLKPGGHLLAFAGTRTYHRMVCAIEDAGFEIRDQIGWAFGSGFPKSHNGDWGGTALKPAWEPIVLARRPLTGTVEQNWSEHGTGALNINGCRIGTGDDKASGGAGGIPCRHDEHESRTGEASASRRYADAGGTDFAMTPGPRGGDATGRWPANLIHDGSEEVVSLFPREAGAAAPMTVRNGDKFRSTYGAFAGNIDEGGSTFHGDTGSAVRFFYCAKASKEDRDDGLFGFDARKQDESRLPGLPGGDNPRNRGVHERQNFHPTVKPTDLMRYLCRLVTPKGGIVLDPFMGSGSTGKAAVLENFNFIGIELNPEYLEIARARIAFAQRQGHQPSLLEAA